MKILIEAMHGMGDVVCMLPMIKEVKTNFPNAELTVLVNRNYTKDILFCSGLGIYDVRVIDAHGKKLNALIQCLSMRREKFDLAVASVNTPVKKSKLFMALINAKKTVGIQFSKGININALVDQYHFVKANMLALEELDFTYHDFSSELYPKTDDIKRLIKEYVIKKDLITIGLCVGRGDISYLDKSRKRVVYTRGWGSLEQHIYNMIALINLCLQEDWQVVLIGGAAEIVICNKIKEEIRDSTRIIDTVGKTTVAESIAVSSLCNVQVGVDTGMQHVADAVGIPTISIFGPTNPKTHGAFSSKARFVESKQNCKYCYGTEKYVKCKNRKCLSSIQVEDVFQHIRKVVEKR